MTKPLRLLLALSAALVPVALAPTAVLGRPAFVGQSVVHDAPAPHPAWSTAIVRQPSEWYGSTQARDLARQVVFHQSLNGGWPKNTDLFAAVDPRADPGGSDTIDNHATTLPLAFLALTISAGDQASTPAFNRGLDYLLAAQYANGGWPQFYPLRGGYHDAVTFNDDAMVNVLELLHAISNNPSTYGFIDEHRRTKVASAVARGVETILDAQVRQNGVLTAWCAQHDAKSLAPVAARRFEPASLSGNESVGVVRFLMSLDNPSDRVKASIEGAVTWLRSVAQKDLVMERVTTNGSADRRVVARRGAAPLWARFYDLTTNQPIFMGRDSIPRRSLAEIEQERRAGYAYYGDWPKRLLEEDYPAWKARHPS